MVQNLEVPKRYHYIPKITRQSPKHCTKHYTFLVPIHIREMRSIFSTGQAKASEQSRCSELCSCLLNTHFEFINVVAIFLKYWLNFTSVEEFLKKLFPNLGLFRWLYWLKACCSLEGAVATYGTRWYCMLQRWISYW